MEPDLERVKLVTMVANSVLVFFQAQPSSSVLRPSDPPKWSLGYFFVFNAVRQQGVVGVIKWVNFEMRVLTEGRLRHLQQDLDIDLMKTVGLLVLFWGESQSNAVWKGTEEEISRFIPYHRSLKKKAFVALLNNDFISDAGNSQYIIKGNRKHIEAVAKMREQKSAAGKIGGKISGKIRKLNSKKPNNINGSETERSIFNQTQATSLHYNISNKKEEEQAAPPPAPSAPSTELVSTDLPEWDRPTLPTVSPPNTKPARRPLLSDKQKAAIAVNRVMSVYVREWQKRYVTQEVPDTSGKSRGILTRMVVSFGEPRVTDLIQVYCQHRDKWFERQGHNLATFERVYNQLAIALGRGDDQKTDWGSFFSRQEALSSGKGHVQKTN